MITFKHYLAEGQPEYYSNYPNMATSREGISRIKDQIAEKMGIAASRIKIKSYLENNKPTFLFKFDISTKAKDDPELMGLIIQNLATKVLSEHFKKVTIRGEATVFHSSAMMMPRILMSFYLESSE